MRWLVVGGGSAGCVVAANLAAGFPDDQVLVVEAGAELGGASLVNAGVVVGSSAGYRHRLPLEPADPIGALGQAVLAADPRAATVRLARRGGVRVSAAEAYLGVPPGNVEVRLATAVARIEFDDRRAVGVHTADGTHLAADRVVLCAGAVATPTLLLRSGVTDVPGVGEGLQDHAGASLAVRLVPGAVVPGAPQVAVTVEAPDHQVVVLEHTPDDPGLAGLLAGHLTPLGEGRVTLSDPDGPPLVTLDRSASATDLVALRAAADDAFALARHPAVRDIADDVFVDAHGTTLDTLTAGGSEAVDAWLRNAPSAYHHAAGTCRLGTVTDDIGRVWLYTRLAVCDASLFAGVPRRNPYLSVIDLAERLSSAWVQGLRRERR